MPDSTVKNLWNVILTLLLIYTALIMPYRLAFYDVVYFDAWSILELCIDSLFLIDVFINIFSTYLGPRGVYETKWTRIFGKYLRTWMLIDIFACIPFSLIEYSMGNDDSTSSNYNDIIRLARVPRLYRLLRISRILKIMKTYQSGGVIEKIQDFLQLNSRISKFFGFCVTVLICVHISGCCWYFVAKLENFGPDSWVVRHGIMDDSDGSKYIASIYWSLTTLTTIGFGDITPGTSLERFFTIIWMMFGVGFYSFTIGSLSSVLSSMDTRES